MKPMGMISRWITALAFCVAGAGASAASPFAVAADRPTPREALLVYRPAPPPDIDLAAIAERTRAFEEVRRRNELMSKERVFAPGTSALLEAGFVAAGAPPGFLGRFRFPSELQGSERARVAAAAAGVERARELLVDSRRLAATYLHALAARWDGSPAARGALARLASQGVQLEDRWRRADAQCERLASGLELRAGGFWSRIRLWGRQVVGRDPARAGAEVRAAFEEWGAVRNTVLGAELTYVQGGLSAAALPTTRIAPAYVTGDSALALEDTTEGREVELVPEIRERAAALGTAKAAWDFVRNEVRLDWYFGSIKGTAETLRTMRGNDVDQAALLVALLRAQGTPARFVRGTVELAVLQLAGHMGLLEGEEPASVAAGGALSSERLATMRERVLTVLRAAGIPFEPVVVGGHVVAVRLLHTWVEAFLAFGDYRGVGRGSGARQWVPIDPSFPGTAKLVATPPAADLFAGSALDAETLSAEYLRGDGGTGSPLELVETRAAERLAAMSPQLGYADALRRTALRVEPVSALPGSIPYAVPAVHEESAFLPDEAKHRIRITARDTQGVLFDATWPTHQIVGHRALLGYRPATPEDEQLVALAGGLYEAPASLVQVLPVVRIDGQERALASRPVGLGAQHEWTIELLQPDGSSRRIENRIIAGNLVALGFGAPGAGLLEPDLVSSSTPADPEGPAGRFLYRVAATYANAWTHDEEELANLLQVAPVRPTVNVVLVSNQLAVDESLGVRRRIYWKGLEVDADHRSMTPIELAPGRGKQLLRLSGYQGSWLESQVLAEATGERAVSAVTVIQQAWRNGAPVLEIGPENVATTLRAVDASAEVVADIGDLVARGRRVIVPASPMNVEAWTGTGFIVRDPVTEEGGYFLSGLVSGGQTVASPSAWKDHDLVAKLEAPDAPAATADLSRIARIMKNDASDLQETVVGTPFAKPLVVYVTDSRGVPVSGASVTFRTMEASHPSFNGEPGPITLPTDSRGRASVTAYPDSSVLHWSILRSGAPHDQLIGLDIVTAEVALPTGSKILLAEPFRLTARPDLPSKITVLDVSAFSAPSKMILGQELPGTVVDRFDNPIANQTITWTQSPATGRFVDPADRPKGSVLLLDEMDARQHLILTQTSDSLGRVVVNYINGGSIHRLEARTGAATGNYSVSAFDSVVLEYVFGYVPSDRVNFDGIKGTSFPEPFVFQILHRGDPGGAPWIPIRGDEPRYSLVAVNMDLTSGTDALAPRITTFPTSTGLTAYDDETNAVMWPSYLADDAQQEVRFNADVLLTDGTRDCCSRGFVFEAKSSRVTLKLQRVLPGSRIIDAGPEGSLYFDEAVAATIGNWASYPISLRIVQQVTGGANALVLMPPPELAARDPRDANLLVIPEFSETRIVLPRVHGAPEGTLRFEVVAPNPAYAANDPALVATAEIHISSTRPALAIMANPVSFVSQRAFAAAPAADVVAIQAVATPPMPGADVSLSIAPGPRSSEYVMSCIGCHPMQPNDPIQRIVSLTPTTSGATFVVDPGFHRSYLPGTDAGNALNPWGHGSKQASTAFGVLVQLTFNEVVLSTAVPQDEVDTIRQEYANHDIFALMPPRAQFGLVAASPSGYYTAQEMKSTAYGIAPGSPGELADDILDTFNDLMSQDTQVAAAGTALASSSAVVIDAGVDVIVNEKTGATVSVVTTPLCYPGPPGSCDDSYRTDSASGLATAILAGPDKTANTTVRTFPLPNASGLAALLKPRITSGWRNPERNEAVGGVRRSVHQRGGAADLVPPASGTRREVEWCVLLRSARDQPQVYAQTETSQSTDSVPCITSGVDHVHVQRR